MTIGFFLISQSTVISRFMRVIVSVSVARCYYHSQCQIERVSDVAIYLKAESLQGVSSRYHYNGSLSLTLP